MRVQRPPARDGPAPDPQRHVDGDGYEKRTREQHERERRRVQQAHEHAPENGPAQRQAAHDLDGAHDTVHHRHRLAAGGAIAVDVADGADQVGRGIVAEHQRCEHQHSGLEHTAAGQRAKEGRADAEHPPVEVPEQRPALEGLRVGDAQRSRHDGQRQVGHAQRQGADVAGADEPNHGQERFARRDAAGGHGPRGLTARVELAVVVVAGVEACFPPAHRDQRRQRRTPGGDVATRCHFDPGDGDEAGVKHRVRARHLQVRQRFGRPLTPVHGEP